MGPLSGRAGVVLCFSDGNDQGPDLESLVKISLTG